MAGGLKVETLKQCMAIGVGGFFGALARFFVATSLQKLVETSLPFGTMVVNITGCFILGFFLTLVDGRTISDATRLGIGVGFVGAYTTFSTLMFDCVSLTRDGALYKAAFNLLLSVILGLLAVKVGAICGRRV